MKRKQNCITSTETGKLSKISSYPSYAEAQQHTEDSHLKHLQESSDVTQRGALHSDLCG